MALLAGFNVGSFGLLWYAAVVDDHHTAIAAYTLGLVIVGFQAIGWGLASLSH